MKPCTLLMALGLLAPAFCCAPALAHGSDPATAATAQAAPEPNARAAAARAGSHAAKVPRKQVGKASIYARKFANRRMADGQRMDPADDNAASKTLPLGTKARVTNLETGRSTTVTIQDRGPYVKGRVVDLSPASAREIGLDQKQGVAPVEVRPMAVPGPDGELRPVAGNG